MFAKPAVSAEASNNNHSISSSIPMQQLPAGPSGAAASMTEGPAEAAELRLATCCLRRASNSRKENYVYTIGNNGDRGGTASGNCDVKDDTSRGKLSSTLADRVFPGRPILITATLHIQSAIHMQPLSNTESNDICCDWEAFVSDHVMFVRPPAYHVWAANEFRESVIALLELAEFIDCEQVVVCLDKDRTDSSDMMRAFMYAGFELVYPNVFQHDSSFVLLGSEV
ncbi:acyl-CoA N-acyltransferase [Syncephalis plumigaleata]|nr:acyl-CoA N-acyltransferase [Syncephalis plumigaleata]